VILKSYAAWHNDGATRQACVSGGVASALAEATLDAGGVVIGAAYGEGLSVRHIVVERKEDLPRIRGVRYVHSLLGKDVFEAIAAALQSNRRVFFCGLPCQCAAVRKVVVGRVGTGDRLNSLLLADLICFGAPPQELWLKYVAHLEKKRGGKLLSINPRDKKHAHDRVTYYGYEWAVGPGVPRVRIERCLSLHDPYAQAFYRAIAFRRCCYDCPFRGENRASDLTIGDFHEAQKVGISRGQIAKGVSAILCHTEQGVKALEGLNLHLREVQASDITDNNFPYAHSAALHPQWDRFAVDMKTMDFGELSEKYGLHVTRWTALKGRIRRLLSRFASLKTAKTNKKGK